MKIASLSIINFKGIEELRIEPKAVTVFSGPNGSGKTSILDAFQDLFEGGHHPNRIRHGAKRAEISLSVIEDDGGLVHIAKTITPKSTQLKITREDGSEVKEPQTWLKRLASGISLDPLRFATDKKARAQWLQEAMPLEFRQSDVLAACVTGSSRQALAQHFPPGEVLDLSGIMAVRDRMYESRRQANAGLKQAEGAIATLKRGIPESEGDNEIDWSAKLAEVDAELEQLSSKKAENLRQVDWAETEAITERVEVAEKNIAEIRRKADLAIEQLRARLAEEKDAVSRDARRMRVVVENEFAEQIGVARDQRTIISEHVKDRSRVDLIRQQIATTEKQRGEFGQLASALDYAIDAIDETRRRKLADVPIPGAEIRDGELYIDGIAFDDLNTERQYEVSFMFAGLKPNPLGAMICDRAESFDEERWPGFISAARGSGYQVFVSRVTGGENLRVTPLEAC